MGDEPFEMAFIQVSITGFRFDRAPGDEDAQIFGENCRVVCGYLGCRPICYFRSMRDGYFGGGESSSPASFGDSDLMSSYDSEPFQEVEDRKRKRKFCRTSCFLGSCRLKCVWRYWDWVGAGTVWKPY